MSFKKAEDFENYSRPQLTDYMQRLLYSKAGIIYKGQGKEKQEMKSLKVEFEKKMKEDSKKYEPYVFDRNKYITGKTQKKIIDSILGIQKLPRVNEEVEEEEIKPIGSRNVNTASDDFDTAQAKFEEIYQKNKGKKITKKNMKELMDAFDDMKDIDKAVVKASKHSVSEVAPKVIAEAKMVVEDKLEELSKEGQSAEEKEIVNKMKEAIESSAGSYSSVVVSEPNIVESESELKELQQKMGQLYLQARKMREGAAAQVKDPASGMEVKMAPSEVKKAPSGQLVSSGKGAGKKEEEKKEEPFTPKPVVGTDYQGSKEMFVKPEQKPLEPFGGLQSQNEVEAPYLSTKSDKAIGDVRQVGFIGAQDQLAKVEDVTLEPSERSKSLKRFTNFRWVQSVQNSDLGYASPFQRMDDIDDRRRFGKCFMHVNKMPKDADTQDELDKAKGFNTYSLVPSFDMHSRMQPATPLSFINSTSKFARKLTKDEMEPINQGKRNVNNVKNTLEFPTLLYSDDPLMRIKDKYKNNIVC